MNAQRWLALALVVVIGICAATNSLWSGLLSGEEDEDLTPTPSSAESPEAVGQGPGDSSLVIAPTPTAQVTPTLDPVIVDLMQESGIDQMGVGDEPFVIMAGDFTSIDAFHYAQGTASVYQIGDFQRILRLDPFSMISGPDLHVILSLHPQPRTSADALLPTHQDLGVLDSISGAQNYSIPDNIDLDQFESVVIYSMSFNLVFSTARLEQVRG